MQVLSRSNCAVNDLFPETVAAPDPLIGRAVKLEAPHRCGSTEAIISPGRGPHAGSLVCAGCGIHRQWISRDSYTQISEFVAEIIRATGEQPAEIIFRPRSNHSNQSIGVQ
jgi:hypothetical protein